MKHRAQSISNYNAFFKFLESFLTIDEYFYISPLTYADYHISSGVLKTCCEFGYLEKDPNVRDKYKKLLSHGFDFTTVQFLDFYYKKIKGSKKRSRKLIEPMGIEAFSDIILIAEFRRRGFQLKDNCRIVKLVEVEF